MVEFDEVDDESVERFFVVSREVDRRCESQKLEYGYDFARSCEVEKAVIHHCLPDPREKQAYQDWLKACSGAFNHATPEELIRRVETTNFLSPKICDNMTGYANAIRIPIGFDGDMLYRLYTHPDMVLRAHPRKATIAAPSSDSMLGPCFLGVNVTVQPPQPAEPASSRRANLSETSIRTAESADADADTPGFIFLQLGPLEAVDRAEGRLGPWKDYEDEEIQQHKRSTRWADTGFVVVARLSRSGYIDGIYAIYDMTYEYTVDDEWRPERASLDEEPEITTEDNWGVRFTEVHWWRHHGRGRDDQFSCVKLGSNLSSLGKDCRIAWTEKIRHPVELVRVKRLGDGSIVRVTIDDKVWPSTVGEKKGGGAKVGGR